MTGSALASRLAAVSGSVIGGASARTIGMIVRASGDAVIRCAIVIVESVIVIGIAPHEEEEQEEKQRQEEEEEGEAIAIVIEIVIVIATGEEAGMAEAAAVGGTATLRTVALEEEVAAAVGGIAIAIVIATVVDNN